MAIDRRTGQTIIDPVAASMLAQARRQAAPNVQGGFLAPIAETASGLFREKRARDDMRQAAQERGQIIGSALQGGINPETLFSTAMQLQMRGTPEDSRAAQQLLQMGGMRQDMMLANRADSRADKALSLQEQSQRFSQNLQSARFAFNKQSARDTLALRRAQFDAAQEAAMNAPTEEDKIMMKERAKLIARENKQIETLTPRLVNLQRSARKVDQLSRIGQAIPNATMAEFQQLAGTFLQGYGNFVNLGNEPPQAFQERSLENLLGMINRGERIQGSINAFAATLGMSPEERLQVLGAPMGSVQATQGEPQTGQGQPVTIKSIRMID